MLATSPFLYLSPIIYTQGSFLKRKNTIFFWSTWHSSPLPPSPQRVECLRTCMQKANYRTREELSIRFLYTNCLFSSM